MDYPNRIRKDPNQNLEYPNRDEIFKPENPNAHSKLILQLFTLPQNSSASEARLAQQSWDVSY